MIVRWIIALTTLCLVFGCSRDDATRKRLKGFILDKEPKIEKKLNVDFDGKIELIGYKFNTKSPKSSILPSKSTLSFFSIFGKIELIGYKFNTKSPKPDKKVKLTLYWRPKQKLDDDMRLSTQVLDGSGERVASLD